MCALASNPILTEGGKSLHPDMHSLTESAKHSDPFALRLMCRQLPLLRCFYSPLLAHVAAIISAQLAKSSTFLFRRLRPRWRAPVDVLALILQDEQTLFGDGDGGRPSTPEPDGEEAGALLGEEVLSLYTPPEPPQASFARLGIQPAVGEVVEARFEAKRYRGINLTPGGSHSSPGVCYPWERAKVLSASVGFATVEYVDSYGQEEGVPLRFVRPVAPPLPKKDERRSPKKPTHGQPNAKAKRVGGDGPGSSSSESER